MPERDPESDPRAFLAKRLKRARIKAGYSSQDALAAKLGFDRSVITKAESGDRVPSAEVLTAWCTVCGLDEELYTDLAMLARRADGPVPTWFEGWLVAEGGTFSLASGDGAPEVLVMDGVEDVTTESRSIVRKAANIFVRVQADALPRAASRARILEKAEQWKTR